MNDNILTAPWLQQGDLFAYPPRVVAVPANTWTEVLSPDPMRFTATVCPSDFAAMVKLSPVPVGTTMFATTGDSPYPFQLHASVFPLVIGATWYAFSTAAIDLTVIEVIRRL